MGLCGELVVADAMCLRKTDNVNERMSVTVFNVRCEFLGKLTNEVVRETYLVVI